MTSGYVAPSGLPGAEGRHHHGRRKGCAVLRDRWRSSCWFRSVAVVAGSALLFLGTPSWPGAAAATTQPTWGKLATLNAYGSATAYPDPLGGSLLYESDNSAGGSYPNLVRVSAAGKVGTAVTVPSTSTTCTDYGNKGPISVMSNGDAIVVWYSIGTYSTYSCMAEYFSNGTFGPTTFVSDGISNVSAQPGEVLTSNGGSVFDWTIGKGGALTEKGSGTSVMDDPVAGSIGIALDPDGAAVAAAIVYTDDYADEELYTATRSTSGTWATAKELAASNDDANGLVMASAPDGRAIISWEDWSTNGLSDTVYAAVAMPGKGFTTATTLQSISSTVLTYGYETVAAGADGTLAAVSIGIDNTDPYSYTTTTKLDVVAPTATTLGAAKSLAAFSGHLDLTYNFIGSSGFTIQQYASGLTVAAGDGAALVAGITQTETAEDPSDPGSSGRDVTVTVLALRVAGSTVDSHALATSSGAYAWSGDPNPPTPWFSGAAIDDLGNGVLTGALNPKSSNLEVESQTMPVPVVTLRSTKVSATATSAGLELACAAAACRGTAELESKSTVLAKATYSIASGRSATVKLALTAAGKKAFADAKSHAVSATASVSVTGGATVSKSVTVS